MSADSNKIPAGRIRMLVTVRSDIPFAQPDALEAIRGKEYEATANRYGAVTAWEGEKSIGLKPGEYERIQQ